MPVPLVPVSYTHLDVYKRQVLEVTQTLLANYDSSLREQLFGLRNQAQVEAIEAKIEFLQPIIRFVGNSWGYLIYFFMALPLLTLLFKLDSWLTPVSYTHLPA